jgi:hypothetical protein
MQKGGFGFGDAYNSLKNTATSVSDAYGRTTSSLGRVANKGLGTLTGNTLTESKYDKFNFLTHKLIDNYNVSAFLPPRFNTQQSIDNLLSQLKLFDKAIDSVYTIRLAYLKNKYTNQERYRDPGITDTERKIEEVQKEIFKVQEIQSSIRSALTNNLHAEGLLINYEQEKERKNRIQQSSGASLYLDPFTLQFLIEGFGQILYGMGYIAGEMLKSMGGRTKRKRHKAKKTKRSKRRKTVRRR